MYVHVLVVYVRGRIKLELGESQQYQQSRLQLCLYAMFEPQFWRETKKRGHNEIIFQSNVFTERTAAAICIPRIVCLLAKSI